LKTKTIIPNYIGEPVMGDIEVPGASAIGKK
jgi:hypothetical protein